jgi:NhaA family Na+:H+ antiporter
VARTRLFARGSWPEASRAAEILRAETTGGLLLIAAAVAALVWANLDPTSYDGARDAHLGVLSVGEWTADGLLAIFFFVAGLELKREFVAGDLRDPGRAALPVAAALGGMALPALVFTAWNAGGDALSGWAIPTATDIAFATAILAVISTHLPSGLRTFLLTLAVVDDLLAITIIAVFYTESLALGWLLLALAPLGVFAFLVQRRVRSWWLLLPLAAATWWLVHASGVHATVAGVLLAFTVPVVRRASGEGPGLAEHFEHRFRPLSAGVAVPLFALFAAGVHVTGSELGDALTDPVTLGIASGLVVGKAVGISGSTWLLARFTRAELDDELSWVDVIGVAMLAGVGFTVSLLIGELAYGPGSPADDRAKIGVLLGSLVAILAAAVVLRLRNRVYRRLWLAERRDDDGDGVPDVYQWASRDPRDVR